VSAVVLNLTAAAANGPGFVTVFPGDEDQPSTSNLNLSFAGENRPNAVILDTRGNGQQIPAGGTTNFAVTGQIGIPSTANAVALNLTTVRSLGPGFVTGSPSDEDQPLASNLKLSATDVTIANLAVLPVREPSGRISLFTEGGAHLLGDTTGYFL
jgi:hypothetical protein